MLSLVENTAFRLERQSCKAFFKVNFPPMRALETGHVIHNPTYTYKFQLKTTLEPIAPFVQEETESTFG